MPITQSQRRAARCLMRAAPKAALATLGVKAKDKDQNAGVSFASLTLTAYDYDGAPLLLLSRLSEHTRHIRADPRLSLLFTETGQRADAFPDYPGEYPEDDPYEDPLSRPRLTVIGEAQPSDDPRHRKRFLARHPASVLYAGFGDFSIYRVRVIQGHLVAGFAQTARLDAEELILSEDVEELASSEDSIQEHMNHDHADAVALYATALLGQPAAENPDRPWRLTGVDPDGCDLRCGGRLERLDFPTPVFTGQAVRDAFITLSKQARGHKISP